MTDVKDLYDVKIIGGGPALTAALSGPCSLAVF